MFFTLPEALMPSLKCFSDKTSAIDFATRNPYKWSGAFILRNKKQNAHNAGNAFIVVRREALRSATIHWDVSIEMEID